MKKLLSVLILIVLSFSLVACGTNKSAKDKKESSIDWLKGTWYSSDWDVTYKFEEKNNEWTIKNKSNIIAEKAKLDKKSTETNVELVSKEGTKFVIEKIDSTHMNFYQAAKEGLAGTTNKVEFVKK